MKHTDSVQIIKAAKNAVKEYLNWGEEEVMIDAETDNKADKVSKIINRQSGKKEAGQTKNAAAVLDELKKQVVICSKCSLGAARINPVFGVGDPYADLMFIGEGPGFQEDHKGEPFIGRAGALLDKIIESMGYSRQTVYIANIVKCHPMKDPSNPELRANDRPPTSEEMAVCKPYLDKQIEIISPKVIVTLGASSTKALLSTDEIISSLRGKFTEYKGIKLMPTYHPAALLRNPNLKKDVWKDMKLVMSFLKKG